MLISTGSSIDPSKAIYKISYPQLNEEMALTFCNLPKSGYK